MVGTGTLPRTADAHHEHFCDRFKQTMGVLFFWSWALTLAMLIVIALPAMLILLVLYPILWLSPEWNATNIAILAVAALLFLYSLWFLYDRNTYLRGGRFCRCLRNLSLWRHCAQFYPIQLVKTAPVPADRNYIFAIHPHGPGAFCSAITFGTNGAGFDEQFPGIEMHLTTITPNFFIPFRRELPLALGLISADREAIEHVLGDPAKGRSVALLVGGVRESKLLHPTRQQLVLANRKGFIKLAIKHGASLVPVYVFGESNTVNYAEVPRLKKYLFKNWEEPILPVGQSLLAALLPPSWHERLPFWLRCGFLPFRRPVNIVVGTPMDVEQCSYVGEELVDRVHAEYCSRLRELFAANKSEFGGMPDDTELELLP